LKYKKKKASTKRNKTALRSVAIRGVFEVFWCEAQPERNAMCNGILGGLPPMKNPAFWGPGCHSGYADLAHLTSL
jgi:hypothetical protein